MSPVRHVEETWKQAGQRSLVAAARHRPSGEPAAYSVLQIDDTKPWLASQDDTLVAAIHRGRRLGMLVKIHNLRRLLVGYPAVQRVTTFNAAENSHMLAINIALGFRPAGYDGEWQRIVVTDVAAARARHGHSPSTRPRRPLRCVNHGTPVETGICWRLKARLEPGIGHRWVAERLG